VPIQAIVRVGEGHREEEEVEEGRARRKEKGREREDRDIAEFIDCVPYLSIIKPSQVSNSLFQNSMENSFCYNIRV
jgi:hypothetical protein